MKANQLTVAKVRTKTPGRYTDGGGLMLLVKESGARSWVLRVVINGTRCDIGLGSVDLDRQPGEAADAIEAVPIGKRKHLTLAEARQKAADGRRLARSGIDPRTVWDKVEASVPTFENRATTYWNVNKASWRNDKHRETWLSSLQAHAFPTLGNMRVDEIDASHICDALRPIWYTKPETANRVQQRICAVLGAAKLGKERTDPAPSAKEIRSGFLARSATNSKQAGNYAAMDYADLPELMRAVRNAPTTVARLALQFNAYTCTRTGEVRGMRWREVDLDAARWVIPGERMKRGKEHVVPLSKPAVAILKQVAELFGTKPGDVVFPGVGGKPMSDATIAKAFKLAGGAGFTVHGSVRAGFRTWCAETQTSVPDLVAEAVLAHDVKDKVVKSYMRSNFFDMRVKLMDIWAQHLNGASSVVPLAVVG